MFAQPVVIVVVGVLVLALAGAGLLALFGDDGIDHPDEWDERVLEHVEFVERERGLEFEHPVRIEFLTDWEYSRYMRADEADFTDEELDELEQSVALLRSLGLVDGEFDLLEVTNNLADEGTLAVYSFEDRTIRVRGTVIDVSVEVTLVHELVHALQDQHFDLGRLSRFETAGEQTGLRAVVEGDATAVEERYLETLPPEQQDAYAALNDALVDDLPFDDIPEVLIATFAAPYALGAPLVELAHAEGGWRAVDGLLEDPPTTELELLDPQRAMDGFEPVVVDPPEADDGEEIVDDGDFGALTLYLMLASRIDPLEALLATDGWAGDAYIATTDSSDRLCIDAAFRARDTEALERLESALAAWVSAAPAETDAASSTSGGVLTVTSCDPGTEVSAGIVTGGIAAINLPSTRSYLQASFLGQGAPRTTVDCMVDNVLSEVDAELLADPNPSDEAIAEFEQLMFSSMMSCGPS